MKTPRDILFGRHRAAEPKLDAVRRNILTTANNGESANSWSLRDFLWSLRWHLVGMSAIWLVIIFLNLGASQTSQMMATVAPVKRASPQVVLLSLRENRRQIAEMIENPTPDADKQKDSLPKPRSELRNQAVMV